MSFYDLSGRIAHFFIRKKKSHDFSAKAGEFVLAPNALTLGLQFAAKLAKHAKVRESYRDWKSLTAVGL